MKENKEGFWYSKYEPDLPMPKAFKHPWKNKDIFLSMLEKVEARAQVTAYRGWSTCRLCGRHNGSQEFEYRGWRWPEGYRHYVQEHNVIPSPAFDRFIEANWRE
jgi:hypothetical protein